MATLYLGTDHVVSVTGLQNNDGSAITGATVTARVLDGTGGEVSGTSWPITLSGDGSGNYEGTLPAEVALSVRGDFKLEIVAEGGGLKRTWKESISTSTGTLG